MKEIFRAINDAYFLLDKCIDKLLKGRITKDEKLEQEAYCDMTYAVNGTMQNLSYLEGRLKGKTLNEWIKIERDKDGFIDAQSKGLLYNSLPVIIWDSKYKEFDNISEDNWYDWLHDLEKPRYTHYMPIVPPKDNEVWD